MKSHCLTTLSDPLSSISESYKMFRTNLDFMNIDKENRVILFTSAVSEEGKSTSIANTAISFSMTGRKVLLVEGDLRKSRVHSLFNILQIPGLTNALAHKKALSEVVQPVVNLDNLHILTSGPLPPDPAELLATHAFEKLIEEARCTYEMIFIDAPPVLSVADATVLSRVVDGVVLVIAANQTKKEEAKQAKKALEKVGANIIGALMTKAETKKRGAYYYSDEKKQRKLDVSYMNERNELAAANLDIAAVEQT